MLLKDFLPAPEVQEFVQLYRIVHLKFEQGQAVPFKAYAPRPEQCLAFYPFDTETVEYKNTGRQVRNIPVVLYGQFSELTHRMIGNHFLVFQVIFYPGALYRLTGIPSAEFTNHYLDAEAVFSTVLREVNEQLYHAGNYPGMIAVMNDFVKSLIKKQQSAKLLTDAACIMVLNGHRTYSLKQLASQACLSSKQLERRFKERTGVNPKLFERIVRFDKAFRLKNSYPKMDWLRIAVECNYHDYQHLVKDYKDFTGYTPNTFFEIENKAPERNFGLSEGYYSG